MRALLRYLALLLLIVVLSIAGFLILPSRNGLSKEQIQQLQSDRQLKEIANLMLMCEELHAGPRPRHMSELAPSNRSDIIAIFYAPNRISGHEPAGWKTNSALIDDFSDYRIVVSNAKSLAFEKPDLWLDGTVAVCLTNLDIIRTNVAGLDEILGRHKKWTSAKNVVSVTPSTSFPCGHKRHPLTGYFGYDQSRCGGFKDRQAGPSADASGAAGQLVDE